MRSLLRALAVSVLLLLLAAAGYGVWLLSSERGARHALGQLAAVSGLMEAQLRSGALLGPLELDRFRYETSGLLIEMEDVRLAWAPSAILLRRLQVDAMSVATVRIQVKDAPPRERRAGEAPTELPLGLDLRQINIGVLEVRTAPGAEPLRFEKVQLAGRWIGDEVQLNDLVLMEPRYGAVRLRGKAMLQGDGMRIEQLALLSPATLRAQGFLSYAGASDLKLAWERLQWPLIGTPQVQSARGELSVQGKPADYRFQLQGAAIAAQVPAQVEAKGSGGLQSLRVEALQAQLLDGSLALAGGVGWSPALRIELNGEARKLNPASHWPEWPGRLNALISAQTTRLDGGGAQIRFSVEARDSVLRGYPLAARLQGEYTGEVLQLATIEVRSGRSQLRARGQVLPVLDLSGELASPRLHELVPQLGGKAQLVLAVSGAPANPRLVLRGDLSQLSFRGRTIAAAHVDADLNLQADSRLDLQLRQLNLGRPIERVDLHVDGPIDGHKLSLRLQAPDGAAELGAVGSLDLKRQRWYGELTSGRIAPKGLAPWTLEEPAAVLAAAEDFDLEPACWRSVEARACVRVSRQPGAARVALRLENFGFAYFQSLLPKRWSVSGAVSGAGYVDLGPAGPTDLSADFTTTAGQWRSHERVLLDFQSARIEALERPDGRMQLLLRLPFSQGIALLDAQLAPGGALMQRALGGTLEVKLPELQFLRMLSTEIQSASGRVEGRLQLSGTLAAPHTAGRIELLDGRIKLAAPGLDLSGITAQLEGSSQAGQLRLKAQAQSDGGSLTMDGQLETTAGERKAQLAVRGENFQAVRTPDARIWISPDLQLRWDKEGVALGGSVLVPRAEITPQQFQTGVAPSRDQVIVGQTVGKQEPAREEIKLSGNVKVTLGEQVRFDGFGLKTRLTGTVQVVDQPLRPTSAYGELRLIGGQYKAYGQDLIIETGRLLFNGGALTDPAIEIRAQRTPREDITVGVYVRGTLDSPQFNLYSTPAMPQQSQLSWLVLGRPLEDTGGSTDQRSMLASAALSLGLSGSDYLAKQFHGRLGLDEISIGARPGEASDQARLTIGKYLSPKLFVSYGVGLFQQGHSFRLRYDIGRGFKLQTETGVESGGDVLYSIER